MKKIPVTEQNKQMKQSASSDSIPSSVAAGSDTAQTEAEDSMSGLQADLDRFRDLALRSQADFENYKKRSARERLGLAAAKDQGAGSPIYSGMVLVQKQLGDLLAENGLQPVEAEGKTFDPNVHEAIAHEPSDRFPEGIVVRQTRRGYRFKDRLLRPAKVVVSSGPAK